MSNLRSKYREFQREYYGGYCNKCRENSITPLIYTEFKEVLKEALNLYEFKKDVMKYLLSKSDNQRTDTY